MAAFVLATLVFSSCGGSESAASGGAVIDTLANGAIRVVNTAEGIWGLDETKRWVLAEDLRIGVLEGEAPYVFGSVRNVFPATQGRIWVMDAQASELRLFNPDGSFERAVGKQGEGPGEFAGRSPCAFPGPNGEVWVEDSLRRWQRFNEEGSLVGSHRFTSNFRCGTRRWTPDGRFLVEHASFPDRTTYARTSFFVVHRMGTDGELTQGDTVLQLVEPPPLMVSWVSATGRYSASVPFTHEATWDLGPSGDVWVTDGGGSYAIRRQSPAGDTLLMIERPHVPVPVPDRIRDEAVPDVRPNGMTLEDGFDLDQVPRVYPPFDSFTIGTDGTLWVRKQLGDGAFGLDVFSPDGIYLGEAIVPPDFAQMRITYAGPDWLYGIVTDDLDVQYVVRLEVRRPGT